MNPETLGSELRIPVFPPPPSRLSSPSPAGSQCESPAPLVMTAEEMAQLEVMKQRTGPPPPAVAKPIPEDMRKGWWRITRQEDLQATHETLHSRGAREREFKRILTKYLDHALESCGKVNI